MTLKQEERKGRRKVEVISKLKAHNLFSGITRCAMRNPESNILLWGDMMYNNYTTENFLKCENYFLDATTSKLIS